MNDNADERARLEEIVMPGLLRHARNTYGVAMRQALAQAGFDDLPRNGLYILGGLAMGAGAVPLGQLVRELRVSKQAAGQLVDLLVLRGYLDRTVDPEDRRKLSVALTERGRAAAAVTAGVREKIDADLLAKVGLENVLSTRRTLAVLVDMVQEYEGGEDDDH